MKHTVSYIIKTVYSNSYVRLTRFEITFPRFLKNLIGRYLRVVIGSTENENRILFFAMLQF